MDVDDAARVFSEVVRRAADEGPQFIDRDGHHVAVVISIEEFHRLGGRKPTFLEFLMAGPDLSALDIRRNKDLPREINFPE